ncbi:hypothetical protein VPH35_107024 [Triticum aestivum]
MRGTCGVSETDGFDKQTQPVEWSVSERYCKSPPAGQWITATGAVGWTGRERGQGQRAPRPINEHSRALRHTLLPSSRLPPSLARSPTPTSHYLPQRHCGHCQVLLLLAATDRHFTWVAPRDRCRCCFPARACSAGYGLPEQARIRISLSLTPRRGSAGHGSAVYHPAGGPAPPLSPAAAVA